MADRPGLPTQPSLIGDKLFLRPATADDIAMTHHWLLQSELQMQSCRPQPVLTAGEAADQFRKLERSTEAATFIGMRRSDNVAVARVRYFDLNPLNGSAELGVLVDPDERGKGYGREAIDDLTRYLFRQRGLRKVYAQTGSFNLGAIRMLEALRFRKDATLRSHHFFNGEYHDDLIYSLLLFEFGG